MPRARNTRRIRKPLRKGFTYMCVAGHWGCANAHNGPCSAQPTNSNPTTVARQQRRKRRG